MHRKEFKISIGVLLIAIFTTLICGAGIFSYLEGWTFIDAFYFVTATATTVGYGDLTPTNNLSKIFTIIFSLSIVPFVLYTFSIVAKYQTEHVYRKITKLERKQRKQEDILEEQETELEKTEKKIRAQKKILNEQEGELEKTEHKLDYQAKVNRKQEKELEEYDKELEAVTDVVGEVIEDQAHTKKKKDSKKTLAHAK